MGKRKSWREKRDTARPPQVKVLDKPFAGMQAGQKMLIPSPSQIDAYLRAIPLGESRDVPTMRRELAARSGADVTCPVTTGIFLRILAEAAWEEMQQGKPVTEVTPVWRVLDARAPLWKKVSFDPAPFLEQRTKEGLPA